MGYQIVDNIYRGNPIMNYCDARLWILINYFIPYFIATRIICIVHWWRKS